MGWSNNGCDIFFGIEEEHPDKSLGLGVPLHFFMFRHVMTCLDIRLTTDKWEIQRKIVPTRIK